MKRCRWPLAVAVALALSALPSPAAAQRRTHYFVEAGGNSGMVSLNLEVRTWSTLRLRAGAGLAWIWPTIPFTATVALGRGSHSLEVGGGATVIIFPPTGASSGSLAQDIVQFLALGKGIGTVAVGTGVLGYRHEQPGGFLFRAALTPFLVKGSVGFWGGISIGGAF